MYRLHGLSQSGNTFKIAFALRALGQPFEAVWVDFFNGQTRTAAWRESVNEVGEVPVLEDRPRKLTQSGAILLHLARTHGALGGRDQEEQDEVLRWLLFDNHKFTSHMATYRFMKAFMPTRPDPAVMAFLRGQLDNSFGIVEKHLSERKWMVGDGPMMANVSFSGDLYYPVEESGYAVPNRFPAIGRWLERLRQLPGWGDPCDILPGERVPPRW